MNKVNSLNSEKSCVLVLGALVAALWLDVATQFPNAQAAPAPGKPTAPMPAQIQPACCTITRIDTRTGLVTARETATGRTFQFTAPPTLLPKLRVGQSVWADNRTQIVSVEGTPNCCKLAAPQAARAAPAQQTAQPVTKDTKTTKGEVKVPSGTPPPTASETTMPGAIRGRPESRITAPQASVWRDPAPAQTGPITGADTYVKIGTPFESPTRTPLAPSIIIEATVGNASNVNVANVVAKLRVTSKSALICEAVSPPLYVMGGDAIKAFWVRVPNVVSPEPASRQRPIAIEYQIEVEANYLNYEISQVESNTANNRQVTTISFPWGAAPRCIKGVNFRDEVYPVFAHYRCINCHGRVDPVKLQRHTDAPYAPSDNPPNCTTTCHHVKKWTNAGVPVFWIVYGDKVYTPYMLCQKVKENTPIRAKLYEHLTQDPRMRWAFDPDGHQLKPNGPAPGGHASFIQKMMNWFDQGKPCPSP
jgi:hypothetical protein